jgi:uroporphyrin-III C-methyltransferase
LAQTAAQAKLTLVIYMGISGVARIQQKLLNGMDAATPVAIIQNASLPHQRQVVCTLDQLQATIVRESMASPSVIVVGDVVRGAAVLTAPESLLLRNAG